MEQFVAFISNHWVLSSLFVVTLVAFLIHEMILARAETADLTPLQAIQLINHEKAVVLDIRSKSVYAKGHIVDSLHIELEALDKKMALLEQRSSKPIILVCANGQQSRKLLDKLQKKGLKVFAMQGGIQAWTEAQLPLVST